MKRLLFVLLSCIGLSVSAQNWAVKTNLLYDMTATMNLGAEVRMSSKCLPEYSPPAEDRDSPDRIQARQACRRWSDTHSDIWSAVLQRFQESVQGKQANWYIQTTRHPPSADIPRSCMASTPENLPYPQGNRPMQQVRSPAGSQRQRYGIPESPRKNI